MIKGSEILKIVLPKGPHPILPFQPRELWAFGNVELLQGPLLAIVCAREIDASVRLTSLQLIQQLAKSRNVGFIGGWHSQLEQESLRILLTEQASLVFCISKTLERFKVSAELKNLVAQKKALLLTHCTPRAKRISREASLRRNQLVVRAAAALLVLSAPEGSQSFNLARAVLKTQKPVFALDHQVNKTLLDSGASVATVDSICAALH